MRILFFVILLVQAPLFAQNLILNPSFEDTLNDCWQTNYNICRDWVNPNGATADYYNPYVMECWGSIYQTPHTRLGYQIPQHGGAYIGLVLYQYGGNIKEYAQGFLSEPLIAGQLYHIAMYINMADSSEYKTCEIDLAFSNELIYTSTGVSLNLTDRVVFDISDVDSVDWKLLTGTYVASGGEKYIYIGSNTSNNILSASCIEQIGDYLNAAYYFIDNVYVSENPLLSVENEIFQKITIFPNPADNEILISGLSNQSHYFIYDLSGNLVDSNEITDNKINTKNIANGFYHLQLNQKQFKIFINHN